jgi:signal transduction histidine kinase
MTLKHYIFLLVTFIILILTVVQLSFVSYIKEQVNNEIQHTSQALSQQIIAFAQESLEQEPLNDEATTAIMMNESINQFYVVKVIPVKKQVIEINDYYSLEIDNGKPIIELTPRSNVTLETQHMRQLLDAINIVQNDDNESFSLIKQTKDSLEQKTFEFQEQNAASNTYFNYLFLLTLILSLLGTIAAYFIAKHISEPLKQLKHGFTRLEHGEFGISLQEQGIVETRKTLQQFNNMSQRLAQLDEQSKHFAEVQHMSDIGEMTRGLAHALRNPINTIGLSLEQMAQPQTTQAQREVLAVAARDKILAMDNTIKSLLTLAAENTLTPTSFNLHHVIQDIVLEVATTNSINVNIDAPKNLPFDGHESEVRSIIHSIVVNAIEASPQHSTISIEAHSLGNKINITITDEGCGIAPHIKPKLFKPHITTKAEGAGMGLYIAKRLSQLHYNGDIVLSDNSPCGCIALITLTPINLLSEEITHD